MTSTIILAVVLGALAGASATTLWFMRRHVVSAKRVQLVFLPGVPFAMARFDGENHGYMLHVDTAERMGADLTKWSERARRAWRPADLDELKRAIGGDQ